MTKLSAVTYENRGNSFVDPNRGNTIGGPLCSSADREKPTGYIGWQCDVGWEICKEQTTSEDVLTARLKESVMFCSLIASFVCTCSWNQVVGWILYGLLLPDIYSLVYSR